jgi:hypothetical protein
MQMCQCSRDDEVFHSASTRKILLGAGLEISAIARLLNFRSARGKPGTPVVPVICNDRINGGFILP